MKSKKLAVFTLGIMLLLFGTALVVPGQPDITPPRNLEATGYDGYVYLDWLAPAFGAERVTGYRIYRSLNPDIKQYYLSVGAGETSYRDEKVENGRTYNYWVTATYDDGRETDFSNGATATPLGASPPTTPRDLKGYPGDGRVLLDWDRPEDDGNSQITNYLIYRGPSSTELNLRYTEGVDSEFTDTDVINGNTYYYGVKARNSEGDSEMSNIVHVTPEEGISKPGAPRNLKALSGNGFVELYWEPPLDDGGSSIQSYRIERTDGFFRVFNTGEPVTFYSDETVINGVTYVYRVSAVNIQGEGLKSSEVTAVPSSTGIPGAVGDLTAEVDSGKVVLTWSELDTELDIVDYNVYRGPNERKITFLGNTGGSSEFEDNDVEGDGTYYYMVRAVSNEDKLGLMSNIESATVVEEERVDEGTGGFLLFALIALLIIVVALILVIVILKSKQEPSKESKGPDTEQNEGGSSYSEGRVDRFEDGEWGRP